MTTESKKPAPRRRSAAKKAPAKKGVADFNLTEDLTALLEKHMGPDGEMYIGAVMLSDGQNIAFASFGAPADVKVALEAAHRTTHEQDLRQQLELIEAERKRGLN